MQKRVPWQQLDLSDPAKPKLRCTLAELEALQHTLEPLPEPEFLGPVAPSD